MKGHLKSVPIAYRLLHFFKAEPLPISQMEDQTSHFNNSHWWYAEYLYSAHVLLVKFWFESSPPQETWKEITRLHIFHIHVVDLKYVRIDDLITEMVNISRPFDQSIHLVLIS